MSLGNISDAMAANWLSQLASTANYASVHFDIPNWADPGASEAFNAGYVRQRIIWTAVSSREIASATPLTFPALSEMTIAAVGLWSAETGGTFVAYSRAATGNEIYVPSLQTVTFATGDVAVSLL